MPRTYRMFFYSGINNIRKKLDGKPDNNHPEWELDRHVKAKLYRPSLITFPITFYTSISINDASSMNFFAPNYGYAAVSITPISFRTMEESLIYLRGRIQAALIDAWSEDIVVTMGYDENLARINMTIQLPIPMASVNKIDLQVTNDEVCTLLGVNKGVIYSFTTIINRLFKLDVPAAYDIDGNQLHPFPNVPAIQTIDNLYLRSRAISDKTIGSGNNYIVDGSVTGSSNVIGIVPIRLPFGSIQQEEFPPFTFYNINAQDTPLTRMDFYLTRPDPYRDGFDAVVDFGEKHWSVELEFKECMCPDYRHNDCDGV